MKLLLDTCVWGGAKAELVAADHDVVWTGEVSSSFSVLFRVSRPLSLLFGLGGRAGWRSLTARR